ncbi:glycosyltransferase [Pedobacter namyangjuensis]|uniref:glycosyltransferase n=1 Tax=Pedobacter namyangjuensis TaxID=600626 RepID=UPI000DE20E9A|nr:glycosyltransferase [Pedobacter namyangjuensis]
MIFITVGTANKGFDRLIQKCDELALKYGLSFFAQIGSSQFTPKNIPYKRWLNKEEITKYYQDASAFIIHGGFGTLSEILRIGKPIVVVPRTFENGEAVNDQSDLSSKLAALGFVINVTDMEMLEPAINAINTTSLKSYNLNSNIPEILKESILNLLK